MIRRRPPSQLGPARSRTGALYDLVLRAFPPDVRQAHRDEMVDAIETMLSRRRLERGRVAAMGLAIRVLVDSVLTGAMERTRRGLGDWSMHVVLDDLTRDLKLAIRGLARTRVQTAVLIGTLALGIGSTTAIFSVLNGILFAPLPYDEPQELVVIRHRLSNVDGAPLAGPGGADLLDYQAGSAAIEFVGRIQTLETNLNDDDGAARVTVGWTTPDFFQLLGVQAALGRVLRADDWVGAARERMEDPNFTPPPMAVLLGHGLWTARFGRDPDVIGRSLRLNGQSMTVVGVLAADFRLYLPADAEVPPALDAFALMPIPMAGQGRGSGGTHALARLADGATIDQARSELEAVVEKLRSDHQVHAQAGTEVVVQPLHDQVVAEARPFLWIVFGTVGLLLLIASANVANLLLVRAAAREREFAIRAALGVSRSRIVRQLLTESLVVAVAGAAVGLLVASWSLAALLGLRPANLPRLDGIGLDGTVLAFTAAVSVTIAFAFGLAPALFSARADGRNLVSGRGGEAGTRASVGLRSALIIGQLAVSVVLVVGAGLLVRSFAELRRVDLGVDPDDVVAMDVAVPFFQYRDEGVRASFFVRLAERVSDLPEVAAAGVTARLPLEQGNGGTWSGPVGPDGASLELDDAPRGRYRALTPGALEALGVQLRAGRFLSFDDERPDAIPSVVIDRRFEEAHFPTGAVDRTLRILVAGYTGDNRVVEARVVGIVDPVRFTSVDEPDEPTVFLPYRFFAPVDGTLVLRTNRSPADVAAAVSAVVAELDGTVPVFALRRFTSVVAGATSEARYALLLVGIFAATAVLLAAVGLYGVIATLVQQRTREIGLRVALGATMGDIRRMVGRDGVRMVVPGLLLGFVAAVLAAPALRSLTFQVESTDATTLAATAIVLSLVAFVSGIIPARRAARVDPVRALREE